jgi:pimeloyl-ACP methyl ester carboxylesterase
MKAAGRRGPARSDQRADRVRVLSKSTGPAPPDCWREGAAVAQRPSPMGWSRTTVDGRPATYGHAGRGPLVVFLHGWALSDRTYRHSLARLARQGYRVLAPALPGFGGTSPLPATQFSLAGYGDWVASFLRTMKVSTPVTLVGHSFGGGVAIKTAHDHPDRVGQLVLVNSIGGSAWARRGEESRALSERPIWDWGLHLTAHAFSARSLLHVVPVIAGDAVPNALRHPRLLWHVGRLARTADLTTELATLRDRRLPVVVLWGREDTVVPRACTQSLVDALHDPRVVTVPGDHSWLIGEPRRFVEVLTNVLAAAEKPLGRRIAG